MGLRGDGSLQIHNPLVKAYWWSESVASANDNGRLNGAPKRHKRFRRTKVAYIATQYFLRNAMQTNDTLLCDVRYIGGGFDDDGDRQSIAFASPLSHSVSIYGTYIY